MKFIIAVLVGLVSVSRAAEPLLTLDMDESSGSTYRQEGNPYSFAFLDSERNYTQGIVNESMIFDGELVMQARDREVEADCISDLALCQEGSTLTLWMRRHPPYESQNKEVLVQFGDAPGESFGFRVAIRRQWVYVTSYLREKRLQYRCKAPEEVEPGFWVHLAIIQQPDSDNIMMMMNRNIMEECKELKIENIDPKQQVDEISITKDLYVGGYVADSKATMTFRGELDDIKYFGTTLSISEVRDIVNAGWEQAAALNSQ